MSASILTAILVIILGIVIIILICLPGEKPAEAPPETRVYYCAACGAQNDVPVDLIPAPADTEGT